jgi:hypothetical protein
MWQNSIVVRYLWVSTPILQSLVNAAMLRRRLHRNFPWFLSYLAYAAFSSLVCLILFLSHHLQGRAIEYALFLQELGCVILRFAVIYELFVALIHPFPVLKNTAHWVFRFVMATLLLAGVVLAASYPLTPNQSLILASVDLGDRTVDAIQCGILLLLLLFSQYLHVSRRDFGFGIGIGLGIYACVDLSVASLLVYASKLPVQQGRLIALRLTVLSMSTYLFCLLLWIVYALLPQPAPKMTGSIPEHELDTWNHELEHLLQR